VQRRLIPKRKPDFLRTDEVPRVLDALDDRWRPLFATAIYTGLRNGARPLERSVCRDDA
jgi:integrase